MSRETYDAPRFIGKCHPTRNGTRAAINVDPDVTRRLRDLLWEEEFHAVGYSAFINRACEIAETEVAAKRRVEREEAS